MCVSQDWAWSCRDNKITSKSQWLKIVEVYSILMLHVCHIQHGLCSMMFSVKSPTIQIRGWQTYFGKGQMVNILGF